MVLSTCRACALVHHRGANQCPTGDMVPQARPQASRPPPSDLARDARAAAPCDSLAKQDHKREQGPRGRRDQLGKKKSTHVRVFGGLLEGRLKEVRDRRPEVGSGSPSECRPARPDRPWTFALGILSPHSEPEAPLRVEVRALRSHFKPKSNRSRLRAGRRTNRHKLAAASGGPHQKARATPSATNQEHEASQTSERPSRGARAAHERYVGGTRVAHERRRIVKKRMVGTRPATEAQPSPRAAAMARTASFWGVAYTRRTLRAQRRATQQPSPSSHKWCWMPGCFNS